jgi:6-phosphogluconolactonase
MCRALISTLLLSAGLALAGSAPADEYFVYFGTYTGFKFISRGTPISKSRSRGIYVSRFRSSTGEIGEPELAAEIRNPSFLAIHPNHRFVYAVSEDPESLGPALDKASYVDAYAIDPKTGKLKLLNEVPTGGTSTCYISFDRSGKYVLLANFGSGSVTVLRLNDDGSLGPRTSLIQHAGHGTLPTHSPGPHAHSIDVSPDNRFAVASDLGVNRVLVYRFEPNTGVLTPHDPASVTIEPADAGPRHFTFAPNGKFGYLLSEMSGVITAFAWDSAAGTLREIQSIKSIPLDFTGRNNSGEIAIHPNGRFLYSSNRGPDDIAVFAIDQAAGTLTQIHRESSRGIMPRHFAIDPTGKYLLAANQATDSVVLLQVDADTGRLAATRTAIRVETPVCIAFVPVG